MACSAFQPLAQKFPLFYFLIKNRVEKKSPRDSLPEQSICDGKETTNTSKHFLENQQPLAGLFRFIPMAFLGSVLHRKGCHHHCIFLLVIINPSHSAGPHTRFSPWQSFPGYGLLWTLNSPVSTSAAQTVPSTERAGLWRWVVLPFSLPRLGLTNRLMKRSWIKPANPRVFHMLSFLFVVPVLHETSSFIRVCLAGFPS